MEKKVQINLLWRDRFWRLFTLGAINSRHAGSFVLTFSGCESASLDHLWRGRWRWEGKLNAIVETGLEWVSFLPIFPSLFFHFSFCKKFIHCIQEITNYKISRKEGWSLYLSILIWMIIIKILKYYFEFDEFIIYFIVAEKSSFNPNSKHFSFFGL